MKIEELKKLGFERELNEMEIDTISIVEDYEFRQNRTCVKNFKERAMDFCIKNKISFGNTCNNTYDMVGIFVKIKCPKCKGNMKRQGGSGNGDFMMTNFKCKKCDIEASINLPTERGLSFRFIKKGVND